MTLSKITFSILFLSLTLVVSCSSDSDENKEAQINISNAVDGLEVTLSGNALDSDDTLIALNINWGDGSSIKIVDEFDSIEETHSYNNPDDYTIEMVVINDKADSVMLSIDVRVDYPETALDAINTTMSKTSDKELLILTLNMHTYQEKNQGAKFKMISDVIGSLDVDFVLLQECAQHKNSATVEGDIKVDNMTLILRNMLKENHDVDYNATWDWAHYGWNVWEEGVAVMSKHEMSDTESRYVSTNKSINSILARKVIYAAYNIAGIGAVNVFSAHTHWRTSETSEEQNNQMRNIHTFVNDKEGTNTYSIVGGDFNGNPTSSSPWSQGYTTMIGNAEYIDTFLSVNTDANSKPAKSKYHTVLGDFPGRIDYIFMKQNNDFEVIDSQIIFTNSVVGKVSDHYGVITKLRYKL